MTMIFALISSTSTRDFKFKQGIKINKRLPENKGIKLFLILKRQY